MPIEKARGFMLGSIILNDQDKIVSILTKDNGIIKAVAPGALKKNNRFGAMLELFTEANIFYYAKEGKELVTLSKGDILKSYFDIVSDPLRIFYFFFMDELIEKFLPAEFRAKRIYKLLSSVLKSSESGIDPKKLLLYFIVWFLKIEGLMFNPRLCYNCSSGELRKAWIKDDFSGILCGSCRVNEKIYLRSQDLDFLEWIEKNPPEKLEEWSDNLIFDRLLIVFKNKAEFHGEIKLRSARYLKEFA